MKKFITNEELRDIVSELADNFMENKRYDVTIALSHFSYHDELRISVQDREARYKTISNDSYEIIETPSDSIDISRRINEDIKRHEAAIAELDKAESQIAELDKETESPIEIDCA